MAADIYRKPVVFAVVATVAVLVGTVVTMAYPMLRSEMHPRLELLKPYTALQLAGRDVYQREGCVNCHTQTVRPLKAEVMRYGEYSKAGEFAFDHPFLWGSKRTGPDLARIGGKYPDAWHVRHFENPQAIAEKSNMPRYGWLKDRKLAAAEIESHMKGLGFPFTAEEIAALSAKTELDALVAYLQVLGTAVQRKAGTQGGDLLVALEAANPLARNAAAIAKGQKLYEEHCAQCHGAQGEGDIGPSLVDDVFMYEKGDAPDPTYFKVIAAGTEAGPFEGRTAKGEMPPFAGTLAKEDIWSVVSFIRSKQGK